MLLTDRVGMIEKIARKKAERLFRGGLKDKIFLEAGLERAQAMRCIDALFVGSSYAMYGIISSDWKDSLNLGGISQDFYYAKKIIETVNTKIKMAIILCGYYGPYMDLSLQKNERKDLVGSVYWPVLGDSHNWDCPRDNGCWYKQYRYPSLLRKYCEKKVYDYFYKTNARFDSVVKRGGNFSSLSIDKKMQKALERTRI